MTVSQWMPVTWLDRDHNQPVAYPWDSSVLRATLSRVAAPQSIVTPASVSALQQRMVETYYGKNVILQTGVCTEQFADTSPDIVGARLHQIHDLAQYLQAQMQQPVLAIGRICGQYAKPRSLATETRDGSTLPNYFGDLVNDSSFTARDRAFDCQRLLAGIAAAKACWQRIEHWQKAHPEYPSTFISHEALMTPYEHLWCHDHGSGWLHRGAHLLWAGVRSNQPHHPVIAFLSQLLNPVAIKVGPHTTLSGLIHVLNQLNPQRAIAKVSLITRLGCEHVTARLPPLIRAVQRARHPVLWLCDPMHGNTLCVANQKRRYVTDIISDVQKTQAVHLTYGSRLHGVHLETTCSQDIECLNDQADTRSLASALVDPQLQTQQAKSVFRHWVECKNSGRTSQ